MTLDQRKRDKALAKELQVLQKQEAHMSQAARKTKPASWKEMLESKIPDKVYSGLESAFCKGFSLVFKQGKVIIEKSFNKEEIQANQNIRDYAVQVKGGGKELRQVRKHAQKSDYLNLTITTVEGIGLGALGIGMPDIVLFLGILLKGIYETALNYGFEYASRQEQMLILKMMATSLSTGQDWVDRNREIDGMLQWETADISDEDYQQQLNVTSSVFAMDMLLLKWVQGVPVVGMIGGAANPVYYSKVLKYVQLKYRKRYLLRKHEQLKL